jgi:hypothetical protein
MDWPLIIIGMLTFFSGVMSGVAGNLFTEIITGWNFNNQVKARIHAICKSPWKGTVKQKKGPYGGSITYDIKKLEIKQNWFTKKLTGVVTTRYSGTDGNFEAEFKFIAEIVKQKYLYLDYTDTKDQNVHFGTMLLEISNIPDHMKGSMLHFGAITDEIVTGDIEIDQI